jgi:hypothetical protein
MLHIYQVVLEVLKQLQPAGGGLRCGIEIWLASFGAVVAR